MALQTQNFMGMPIQKNDHSGIRDALPNYLKGYAGALAPGNMEEESKRSRLESALKELELENKPEDYKTQFDLRRAQAEHAKQQADPSARLTGLAAEWNSVNELEKKLGANHPVVVGLKRDLQNRANVQESLYGTRQQNMQFKPWAALNKDEQAKVSGQYTALGIGPSDGLELYTHGITPELLYAYKQQNPGASNHDAVAAIVQQLQGGQGIMNQGAPQAPAIPPAQAQNPQDMQIPEAPMQQEQPGQPPIVPVDTRTVPVQPAMTSSDRSVFNQTKGALAEEQYIHPIITEAMKPYSQKYFGYSPKQFWDTTKKDEASVDKMAKFYAARALQPEIASIRARMAGGSNAAQALHDIQTEALNRINVMDWRVSPKAYGKAQDYISEWMTGMTEARLNAMSGQIPGMQAAIKNSKENKNTVTRTVNGKRYEIPEHLVKQFDEDHK